jgi:hypothetical protein
VFGTCVVVVDGCGPSLEDGANPLEASVVGDMEPNSVRGGYKKQAAALELVLLSSVADGVSEQPVRVAVHCVTVSQSVLGADDTGQIVVVAQSVTLCVEQAFQVSITVGSKSFFNAHRT